MTNGRPIRRRSVYADRLLDFPDFTFSDGAELSRRGMWRDYFTSRIGPNLTGQLIFEIGCNDASFLTRVAARHPTTAFIGIDWKCRALHTAATRVSESNLRNVALLHGRAQDVRCYFAGEELSEIWLFHPDPCDKPNELPNRLFAEPFLRDVHTVLRSSGSLVLKTDHAAYFAAARNVPAPGFDVVASSTDLWNDESVQRHVSDRAFAGDETSYESRFRRRRLPIHYLELRNCGTSPGVAHTACS